MRSASSDGPRPRYPAPGGPSHGETIGSIERRPRRAKANAGRSLVLARAKNRARCAYSPSISERLVNIRSSRPVFTSHPVIVTSVTRSARAFVTVQRVMSL
jgi:hypothetical protein